MTQGLATVTATVTVIEGRPRYHRSDCRHLAGKAGMLEVAADDAVSAGYTPCGSCGPDVRIALIPMQGSAPESAPGFAGTRRPALPAPRSLEPWAPSPAPRRSLFGVTLFR